MKRGEEVVYVAVEGGEGESICSVVEQECIYEGAMLGMLVEKHIIGHNKHTT
jgi:hypothetical protein